MIFVCASYADHGVVAPILAVVEEHSRKMERPVPFWYAPRWLSSGYDWRKPVEAAIHKSKGAIIFASARSFQGQGFPIESRMIADKWLKDPKYLILLGRLDDSVGGVAELAPDLRLGLRPRIEVFDLFDADDRGILDFARMVLTLEWAT